MRKADRTRTGTIFNIQKFCVNDGPGIRTTVFFKGCPLHCRWCANPESQYARPQILRDNKQCLNCGHCLSVCPSGAVSLREGFPFVSHSACSLCGICISECPNNALKTEGEIKSVEEILGTVLQDQPFYEESGGGITLSGGEFLSQPEFAMELLLAAKEEGLHTCCETTGFARPEIFSDLIQLVDYVLFDVKHWDPLKHKEGTGVSNELPLLNLTRAIQAGKTVLPRIPVIPDFNDTLEDALHLAETLRQVGASSCQLLPFHQFGENKYTMLNQGYAYSGRPSLHREDLDPYRQIFLDHGVNAFF